MTDGEHFVVDFGVGHRIAEVNPPRSLTPIEQDLVRFLLMKPFPRNAELQRNVPALVVLAECADCPTIEFMAQPMIPTTSEPRIPTEAEGVDVDGEPFEVLLHVIDGKIAELEFVRYDGLPVKELPPTNVLRLRQ
jgi:hypothetical protein